MAFPEWFDDKFGPHTEELYQEEICQTPGQIETLKSFLGAPEGQTVLDLCCGWGRHSLPLAAQGYNIIGLDGSSYFLNKAKGDSSRKQPGFTRADMRFLPFRSESIGSAIQMYTSFGYGTDPQDDWLVLGELYRVLQPAGTYLLDLINWNLARRAFDGYFEEEYPNFDLIDECFIDPGLDLLRVRRSVIYRDGRKPHNYHFEIRMFEKSKLTAMLEKNGFEVLDMWGDFNLSPYDPENSYRMIAVCRKSR